MTADSTRAAACEGKPAYATWYEADRVLRRRNGRLSSKQRRALEPYRCPFCHKYHLGGRTR